MQLRGGQGLCVGSLFLGEVLGNELEQRVQGLGFERQSKTLSPSGKLSLLLSRELKNVMVVGWSMVGATRAVQLQPCL